jgi:hypothetical protein
LGAGLAGHTTARPADVVVHGIRGEVDFAWPRHRPVIDPDSMENGGVAKYVKHTWRIARKEARQFDFALSPIGKPD